MALTIGGTLLKWESAGPFLAWQRNINGTPTAPTLFGTYDGSAPVSLEASIAGGSFAAMTSQSFVSGNWTATLPAVSGGVEGFLVIRRSNATSDTYTVYFMLGDFFVGFGDSIMVGANINNVLAPSTAKKVRYLANGTYWVELDTTSGGPQSGCWPLLLAQYAQQQNVPVGFLNCGSSGSSLGHWQPGQPQFDSAMTNVTNSKLNNFRGKLMNLFVNDTAGSLHTTAYYRDGILAVKNYLAAGMTVGGAAPLVWASCGPQNSTTAPSIRVAVDAARKGWLDGVALGYAYPGPSYFDFASTDGLHPDTDKAVEFQARWYLATKGPFYGLTDPGDDLLTSLTIDATKTVLEFTWARDLEAAFTGSGTGTSGYGGFYVTDNGAAVSLTGATIAGAATNKIRLTLPAPIVGTCLVSFGSGLDAVGALIPRSGAETLPMGAAYARPVQFFFDHAVTDAPAGGSGSVAGNIFAGFLR